jgi:hypothetical protein
MLEKNFRSNWLALKLYFESRAGLQNKSVGYVFQGKPMSVTFTTCLSSIALVKYGGQPASSRRAAGRRWAAAHSSRLILSRRKIFDNLVY